MKAIKVTNIGKTEYDAPEVVWLAVDAIESVSEFDEGRRARIAMVSGKSYVVAAISADDVAADIWGDGVEDTIIQGKF